MPRKVWIPLLHVVLLSLPNVLPFVNEPSVLLHMIRGWLHKAVFDFSRSLNIMMLKVEWFCVIGLWSWEVLHNHSAANTHNSLTFFSSVFRLKEVLWGANKARLNFSMALRCGLGHRTGGSWTGKSLDVWNSPHQFPNTKENNCKHSCYQYTVKQGCLG